MPIALIVSLLQTFGPSGVQLVTLLISKWETSGTVTAAEWADVTTKAAVTSQDQMKLMLVKAGIDPASTQGATMLALAK